MLETKSAFPHPGSTGYLRGTGDQARVIQHCRDGRLLCSVQRDPSGNKVRTRQVEARDLYQQREDALFPNGKPHRRGRRPKMVTAATALELAR